MRQALTCTGVAGWQSLMRGLERAAPFEEATAPGRSSLGHTSTRVKFFVARQGL